MYLKEIRDYGVFVVQMFFWLLYLLSCYGLDLMVNGVDLGIVILLFFVFLGIFCQLILKVIFNCFKIEK